jgi:hypothetical protein
MLSFVLRRDQKLPKAAFRSLYKTSFYDNSKIVAELNFDFTLYKETIKRVALNYMNRH